jgi:hypothetical protein
VQVLELVANRATNLGIKVSSGSILFALETNHAALFATMAAFAVNDYLFLGRLVSHEYLGMPDVQEQREMLPVELFKLFSRIDHRFVLFVLLRGMVRLASLGRLNLSVLRRRRKLQIKLVWSVLQA